MESYLPLGVMYTISSNILSIHNGSLKHFVLLLGGWLDVWSPPSNHSCLAKINCWAKSVHTSHICVDVVNSFSLWWQLKVLLFNFSRNSNFQVILSIRLHQPCAIIGNWRTLSKISRYQCVCPSVYFPILMHSLASICLKQGKGYFREFIISSIFIIINIKAGKFTSKYLQLWFLDSFC